MKLAGIWLIVASVGFWLAWVLMPGVGVTDTPTIFALVAQHRAEVYASVIVQLLSAAAYAPGIVGLLSSSDARESRALRIGSVLLAIGAMGSAADAIFHLVAYEMTAPSIDMGPMSTVMYRLQGPDLALLLPFVGALFVAHAILVTARRKHDSAARWGFGLLLALPAVAVIGGFAVRTGFVPGRIVGLGVLAALSGSLALFGGSLAWGEARRSGKASDR